MSLGDLSLQHLAGAAGAAARFTAMLLLLIGDAWPATPPAATALRAALGAAHRLASVMLGLLLALKLAIEAMPAGALRVYRVGDWPAPFGIVLVVDRLSALMLLLTSLVALPVLVCQRRLGQSRPPLPRAVPVPADGPERRLRHRRPVQPVRVLRGAADRLYVLLLHGQGASASASACTTWCSTWRPRRCS
jgi:hypothetical protein